MPVSIGKPKGISGLSDIVKNPIYSTAVGLLQFAAGQQREGMAANQGEMDSVMNRVKKWFTN
jgi:cell division protein FtsA